MATQTLTPTANANIIASSKQPSDPKAAPTSRQLRTKLYKDFLTPALHRRFCSAAGLTFLVCLSDSFILSNSGSLLWSWFPLGPAGLRAMLLFIPCLMVFIVRLANMHVGERTSSSAVQTLHQKIAGTKGIAGTINTTFWYVLSGWFFGEIYIWSRSETAELSMIDQGRPYERPRLNENPIALRCLFVALAVAQSIRHIACDYDKVVLEYEEKEVKKSAIAKVAGAHWDKIPRSFRALLDATPGIAGRSFNFALLGIVAFPLGVYYTMMRYPAWRWIYFFAKIFFSDLPSDAAPTGILHPGRILRQAVVSSVMLVTLWETSNAIFEIYTARPPVRKDEPLTSEIRDARGVVLHRSLDPNGSVLTGLKSKKDVTKSFALWELAMICTKYEARRKTIYTEVDRQEGSTWSQICKICLDELRSIQARIKATTETGGLQQKQDDEIVRQRQLASQPRDEYTGLRRIADRNTIQDGNVMAKQKPDFYNTVGSMAKSIGQNPGAVDPVSPHARKVIQYATDRLVSKDDQERLRPQQLEKRATGYIAEILKSPVGQPFRQTFARRAVATIFGTPTSHRSNIVHATTALSQLVVASLGQDDFGQVQKDIATIVRTMTEVIRSIETYLRTLQPHWTDVEFMDERDRRVAQVDELLDILKSALGEIVLAFGEYADALELSKKELREAREASAKKSALPGLPAPAAEVPKKDVQPAQREGRKPEMRENRRRYDQ